MSDQTTRSGILPDAVVEFKDIAVVIGVLAVLPIIFDTTGTYQLRLLNQFLVFAAFAVALNIAFGHTDQLFLFVGAVAGVGAYTTAILADILGLTPWITFPLAGVAAGIIGLIVSYVAARRKMTVIVIAILTLSIQMAISEIFVGAGDITGGTTGMPFNGLEIPILVDAIGISPQMATYYLLAAFLTIVFLLYKWMMNSKYGLAFKAIRQDEIASEAVGINVIKYKVVAGVTAAVIIGLVGPLYAQTERYIFPAMFSFQAVDVLVLIMLVLGGIRTFYGPLFGAALIIYINHLLEDAGQWRTAVLGALLIVLFIYFREGMVPKVESFWETKSVQRIVSSISKRFPNQ
ncbi:branched-chain amino acid ABC transporter permease [Natronosalvus halobius]|uniref:branched-chain amino acid ABC transporter permease n=1 Tax=Natronosalvus halobius TaxID=2953746 RepID=UPI00209CB29A|nr:branched-chain amino acid ABC transporter permease [Natronosalvus halobius]USZ73645.1 branched-chain amino acid ABC transporter permease [Natronosalvus halobius]